MPRAAEECSIWTQADFEAGRCVKNAVGLQRMNAPPRTDANVHVLYPETPSPESLSLNPISNKFREDLTAAYLALGGVEYLKVLAVNQPALFLRYLDKMGILHASP